AGRAAGAEAGLTASATGSGRALREGRQSSPWEAGVVGRKCAQYEPPEQVLDLAAELLHAALREVVDPRPFRATLVARLRGVWCRCGAAPVARRPRRHHFPFAPALFCGFIEW